MAGLNYSIDLNADVGEGVATEAEIIPLLSSCNVACGGHYGDRDSVLKTLAIARKTGIKVGAHPAYPDKANFGRKVMNIEVERLKDELLSQLELFFSCCSELDIQAQHIKPHGALYNQAAKDQQTAKVIVEVVQSIDQKLPLYTLPGGVLDSLASDLEIIPEAFIDRRYNSDYTLVPRNLATALITDPTEAWQQLEMLVKQGHIRSVQGTMIPIKAKTFCVHSDTPGALDLLTHIHQQMAANNMQLAI
jgi:UPF0271 protein